ncbi:MAG TPA: glycosyltransferase [Nitrospirae bacterium]|nr:glycosyltransferase [Nitrospirota bacterium]
MCRSRSDLVIINSEQFGYHIDTYYYCKYLRDRYNISYIGWDHGQAKIELAGVQVEYVGRSGGLFRIIRILRILRIILDKTGSNRTIIFLKYFKGISIIIRLLRRHNPIVLDIRTGSDDKSRVKRYIQDLDLKFECRFFRNITIISESLAVKIGLAQRATILPLGADVISHTEKHYDRLDLLYVGSLYNRNIDKAVEGFARFYREYKQKIPIKFTIIGEGLNHEAELIKKLVKKCGLGNIVHTLGWLMHDQLQEHFDTHNIGVSYIPMTDYYDVQPATKTFEYLLSGLVVIGTATSENRLVINDSNGVLTEDSPEGFYKGLVELSSKLKTYDSTRIRQEALQFNWKEITDGLDCYLKTLQNNV